MALDITLVALLTVFASGVGTLTGFGTSTIMVPVMVSFIPLSETLLFVGIIHWFGNIWKLTLFRRGIHRELILKFGIPGVAMTVVGGLLVFQTSETTLSRVLGGALVGYVAFMLAKGRLQVPQTTGTAMAGGALYGFSAGIFGIGGAVRGAFLAAFDLPKAVYIATGGAIGLAIDSGRLATYWWEGATLDSRLLLGLAACIPLSFVGAKIAERIVDRIPQERFQVVVAAFLAVMGARLLFFPVAT